MNPMKSAVLVIDVQSALFETNPKPFDSKMVLDRINNTIAWANNNNIPIVFIQHEQEDTPLTFQSEGWKLESSIRAEEKDIYVRKTTPDSFLKTDLEAILQKLQIEKIIVCGYASEFCVDTTIRRAAGLGYTVELISDAHTTHSKEHATGKQIQNHHNETLQNISSYGVKIFPTSTSKLISS